MISSSFTFYLGTHKPGWLEDPRFVHVPLFVSRRTLAARRHLPRARGAWALDSGGFTELQLHGQWTIGPVAYAAEVRRFSEEVGRLVWAAPQDWMCESVVLSGGKGFRGTGLTVQEHQRRTVRNLLDLRALAPDLPFVPVLQGWDIGDYMRCAEQYDQAGVNLTKEPIVGVGSVCRRQSASEGEAVMRSLADLGLRLHGFGFKSQGLFACADAMVSADSFAWSYTARHRPPLPGHDQPGPGRRKGHRSCANCPEFALVWRLDVLRHASRPRQGNLFYPGR